MPASTSRTLGGGSCSVEAQTPPWSPTVPEGVCILGNPAAVASADVAQDVLFAPFAQASGWHLGCCPHLFEIRQEVVRYKPGAADAEARQFVLFSREGDKDII